LVEVRFIKKLLRTCLVDVAALIVDSALLRHESRGLHTSLDYPRTLATALFTVLTPEPHNRPPPFPSFPYSGIAMQTSSIKTVTSAIALVRMDCLSPSSVW
jgi:hypothetical protein